MTIIPKISKALQDAHVGDSVAIVNGVIVAFGKTSLVAEANAIKKGYLKEDIITTCIMGTRHYAM